VPYKCLYYCRYYYNYDNYYYCYYYYHHQRYSSNNLLIAKLLSQFTVYVLKVIKLYFILCNFVITILNSI